jgi:hypothetical protein
VILTFGNFFLKPSRTSLTSTGSTTRMCSCFRGEMPPPMFETVADCSSSVKQRRQIVNEVEYSTIFVEGGDDI